MVIDGNYTYSGEHFVMYTIVKSLSTIFQLKIFLIKKFLTIFQKGHLTLTKVPGPNNILSQHIKLFLQEL